MTTIYTGNTTTTGFVVTADNSGDLVLKTGGSGGTTAATFDGTTQQATFNAPVSQPGSFMFRNKIINGNFDIWQRGTSQTSSGYGSADRWQCFNNGSTKTASQQAFDLGQTDVPNNPNYFMRHVVTSVAGAGNQVCMEQRIEGVETLSGQTITVSFWAKADANKNIAVNMRQYFGFGGSPSASVFDAAVSTVSLTTTWVKYTITLSIPSVSGKTLGTDNGDFLGLRFWFDAGSDFNSFTNSLGQQSGTFDIAQVQLEEGTAATPFEMRPRGTELNLCQRYCIGYVANPLGITQSATTLRQEATPLPTSMRAAPTLASGASFTVNSGTAGTPGLNRATELTGNEYTVCIYNSSSNWTTGVAVRLTGTFEAEL